MRIKSLTLKNFKGIKALTITADGNNINVYGDNGAGKTTIADAFNWLLNDKDSHNQKDFGIQPYDSNGETIHNIETEVEAVLDIGLKLKKVYYEKWTKKRGSATQEFTGRTTDYFVDDVPCKKSEYEDKIKAIADEKAFKLLTNPLYINEQLHWQDRRKIVIDVCGNILDQDVIATNSKLAKLSSVLGSRSIEDHKKVIAAKRREINEQLEKIPVRIDEVTTGIPDISGMDFAGIEADISCAKAEQDSLREDLTRIQSGGETAKKEQDLALIDAEIIRFKNDYEKKTYDVFMDLVKKSNEASIELNKRLDLVNSKKNDINSAKSVISAHETTIKELRDKWNTVNSETFVFSQDDTCPTCGQAIPQWQLEEAREKALNAFNLDKSQRLEKISADGKTAAAKLKAVTEILEKLESEYQPLNKEYEYFKEIASAAKAKADEANVVENVTDIHEYKELLSKQDSIKASIQALKDGSQEEVVRYQTSINEVDKQIWGLRADLAKKSLYEKSNNRIAELKAEEKKLGTEFEKLEEELFLTEEFTRAKVNLLESKINSKFKMARFKLFNQQINGGLEDCCEVTFNGVPYGDLNSAARLNIGLDIINTLSEYFNFEAPIFVDNRESVTKLTDVKAQVISLIVSESDKSLRVEVA